jgi:hypothetical protein
VTQVFIDDLPTIKASQLRATGAITAEMTRTSISFGDVEVEVDLSLRRFPNRGSWSLFRCPSCDRRAQVLRLFCGEALCKLCCVKRGLRYRCELMGVRQRAEHRIPKLRAKLESTESLRLKPHLWGTMERRVRLEVALRKAQLPVGYADFVKSKVEGESDAGEDPRQL